MAKPISLEENEFFSLVSLLIVEDEDEIREPLVRFFKKRFKKVYTASNGQDGFEAYELYKPDIIITDIQMPKMSGLDMTREIREKYGFNIPIVILTAFSDEDYLLKSIELGITRYIKKPAELKVIENTVFDISMTIYQYRKVEELDLRVHDLLDLLNNMIILTDGKIIKYANRAFLNFVRYHTFEEFNDKYYLISDLDSIVVKIEDFIIKEDATWFNSMLESNRGNFVTFLHSINENQPKAFATYVTELPRNRGNYIISFSDITLIEEDMLKLREEAKKSIKLQILINEEVSKHREQEQLLIQQSKMAAMGEMMSAIIHQWKQPLNAITIISEQLEDMIDFKEVDEESLRSISRGLLGQAEFMNQTIEDFRNFVKPSKSKDIFCVKSAMIDMINLLKPQIDQKNIEINIEAKNESYNILGYQNELKQVLLNLLNNARDAITEHCLDDMEKSIDIRITQDDNSVFIEIEDSGGGIKGEYKNLIFDPYFSSKGEEGTGIGLYMSKTIITQNMDGDLIFKNGKKGAIFEIKLPKDSSLETGAGNL